MAPKRFVNVLGVLFVMVVAPLLAILALRPPAPVPATAEMSVFSAEGAMRHVEAIAEAPRPVGSAAHAKARHHLITELTRLGLTPEIQIAPIGPADGASGRRLHNVFVRLRGTRSSGAVLLLAHYDSVAFGPGAADDGAAVAALLETLRALGTGDRLRNDIIVLFTDAEEAQRSEEKQAILLGAKAFAATHPWMVDVALVLNFEARGSSGPAIMFETSRASHALIAELARALPRPVASSFAPAVYEQLPNDTDFTVFKKAGKPGFNFAFIDGYGAYHTEHDTIANLDRRSLQHHGDTALALARHFGALDLRGLAEGPDAVYFDLLGRVLVHYPVAWARAFAVATLLVFVGLFAVGLRVGRLTARGVAFGMLYVGGSTGGLVLAVWFVGEGVRTIGGSTAFGNLLTSGSSPKEVFLVMGLWTSMLALFVGVAGWKPWRLTSMELAVAALLALVPVLLAVSFWFPGASYLVLWPVAFGLANLIVASGRWSERASGGWALLLAPILPVLLVIAPALYLMFLALLGLDPALAVLVVCVSVWVSLWALSPLLDIAARAGRHVLTVVLFVSAVGFVAVAAMAVG